MTKRPIKPPPDSATQVDRHEDGVGRPKGRGESRIRSMDQSEEVHLISKGVVGLLKVEEAGL
jgi:hypothetical protein